MANGGYWTIMERVRVDDVKSLLENYDFDVMVLREFMSEKFNKALHRPISSAINFDIEASRLVIQGFKNKECSVNDLGNILHYYIYHHYMVLYHKLDSNYEFVIMRAKILFHASRSKGGG